MKKMLMLVVMAMTLLAGSVFADEGMQVKFDNYSLTVPSGWLVQRVDGPALLMVYSPMDEDDQFQENINLACEKLPGKFTVKGYLSAAREFIKTMYSDFNLVEEGSDYQIISGNINGIALQQVQFVFIKNNTAHVLTCSSTPEDFDRYYEVFKQIKSSFKY